MRLSEIVKEYRTVNQISMDEFSKRSGLSKGYISMLENEINPRNNKPISPTIHTIMKLSNAMGIELDELLKMMDGQSTISLVSDAPAPVLSTDEQDLVDGYRQLNVSGQKQLQKQLSMMLNDDDYRKDTELDSKEAL